MIYIDIDDLQIRAFYILINLINYYDIFTSR